MLGLSQVLIGLVEEATRADAARELARRLRCDRVFVGIRDPETQQLAPLSGMPWQEVPWQESIGADAYGAPLLPAGPGVISRDGLSIGRADDGSLLVASGGRPRASRIAAILPLLSEIASRLRDRAAAAAAAERIQALEQGVSARDTSLREAAALKDEFLATLSHELRTPLNAMLGWIQLLRMNADDAATRQRAIGVLERSARAQVQIVADLLDVSEVITGKMQLTLQPVDLPDVVRRGVETLLPSAQARTVSIESEVSPIRGVVHGDAARLRQMVWNLLSNAIKFTPGGGRVLLRLHQVGENAELEVTDTGVGIAPEVLPFVFDRFRQGDSSITRAYGGLGLGLAIVRHLAELHGGSVSAASAGAGHGATFRVRLPLHPPAEPARDDAEGSYHARGA